MSKLQTSVNLLIFLYVYGLVTRLVHLVIMISNWQHFSLVAASVLLVTSMLPAFTIIVSNEPQSIIAKTRLVDKRNKSGTSSSQS